MTDRKMTRDGYANRPQPITEGYVRKGGLNPPSSLDFPRPPPPGPMRAANPPKPDKA